MLAFNAGCIQPKHGLFLSKTPRPKVYFAPHILLMKAITLVSETKSITMATNDFTTTFVVDQTPGQVFDAITNVRGWWSEEVEGSTDKLNAEFNYHHKDAHVSKMKITELVPGKKVAWLVLENYFNFTNDKNEWKDNKIIFEITQKDNKTQLQFTQVGLVPAYECYDICRDAWTNYINKSLRSLITTGKGQPNPKEGGFNEQLIRQHNKQ